MMFFYKEIKNGELVSLHRCNVQLETENELYCISEEEYESLSEILREKGRKELQAEIENSKSEAIRYTEQLEKENASLLYQILTGEELADV